MYKNIIIANFGNDSIALIEWSRQQGLSGLCVVSVDTGWSAPEWTARRHKVSEYLSRASIPHVELTPEYDFQRLVRERRNFPSIQFHWCASFLKGAPILDWLDDIDLDLEATVMLAKRREQAPSLENLPEFVAEHSAYASRKVWYPLYRHTLAQRNILIQQAGFDLLVTRSLECDPCIYNQRHDFKRLDVRCQDKLALLEAEIGRPMFGVPIHSINPEMFSNVDVANNDKSVYYQGCGSEFGCGD